MKYYFSLLAFVATGLLISCKHKTENASSTASGATTAAPANWAGDKDLVCGMSIDPSTPDTVHYQGKVYGFCSEDCKAGFQKNPQEFVASK